MCSYKREDTDVVVDTYWGETENNMQIVTSACEEVFHYKLMTETTLWVLPLHDRCQL